jgi:predicted SAM-dependent methyltransferase
MAEIKNVNVGIYEKFHTNYWWYSFKFEMIGLLGRTFYNRKSPKKSQLLHLGCGGTYLDNFVNADYYYLRWVPFRKQIVKCDWLQDFRHKLNCPNDHWEGIFTEHTLEHLHYRDCLNLFKELHRTMKTGAWLRICVPGLEEVLSSHSETTLAEQIYNLTQNYGHVSVWDSDLMFKVLRDAGFTTMHKASYLKGHDDRLLCDTESRSEGSLYIEVQK